MRSFSGGGRGPSPYIQRTMPPTRAHAGSRAPGFSRTHHSQFPLLGAPRRPGGTGSLRSSPGVACVRASGSTTIGTTSPPISPRPGMAVSIATSTRLVRVRRSEPPGCAWPTSARRGPSCSARGDHAVVVDAAGGGPALPGRGLYQPALSQRRGPTVINATALNASASGVGRALADGSGRRGSHHDATLECRTVAGARAGELAGRDRLRKEGKRHRVRVDEPAAAIDAGRPARGPGDRAQGRGVAGLGDALRRNRPRGPRADARAPPGSRGASHRGGKLSRLGRLRAGDHPRGHRRHEPARGARAARGRRAAPGPRGAFGARVLPPPGRGVCRGNARPRVPDAARGARGAGGGFLRVVGARGRAGAARSRSAPTAST